MSKAKAAANARARAKNTPEIIDFCTDNGLSYTHINPYQIRIENILDLYPTTKKYCWLPLQEWGFYTDYDDIGAIMVKHKEDLWQH
jgi:hypothetical protein